MIGYNNTKKGDILKITGKGAPGFACNGDLVRVLDVWVNGVRVEDKHGTPCNFVFNCGAARLESTEWCEDFPPATQPAATRLMRGEGEKDE